MILRLLLLLLLALLPTALARGSQQSDLEAIVLNHYQREEPIPGMLVGIWQGESALLEMKLGSRDLVLDSGGSPTSPLPMEFDVQMRIASLTKSFTVTRILQMVNEGYFSLDTKLSDLDTHGAVDFSGLNFRHGAETTLRHLADMTSGVADYSRSPAFLAAFGADLAAPWAPGDLVDFARGEPVATTPWEYSNTNTLLLGMIIEGVTGRSLAEELNEKVITPAGLSTEVTYYPGGLGFNQAYAHGYAGEDDGTFVDVTDTHPSAAAGSGGMVSNYQDLRVWTKRLATGELEDGTSLYGDGGEFLQPIRLTLLPTGTGAGPHYDAYGLGLGEIAGWIGHTGEFLGYQHLIMYDPLADRSIVIMMNRAGFSDGAHVPTELFEDLAHYFAVVPEPSSALLLLFGGAFGGWCLVRARASRQ